jgi:hypothetical protein
MCKINKSCNFCFSYRPEEVGDSDFGAIYSDISSCEKQLDFDENSENNLTPDFDRTIERDCCKLDFWKVLEYDDELKSFFDKEMMSEGEPDFEKINNFFKEKYKI